MHNQTYYLMLMKSRYNQRALSVAERSCRISDIQDGGLQ